jgi:hypothetical protein
MPDGLRAIPVNELVDGMTIPALGVGTGQAVQDCGLGMFKIGKAQEVLAFLRLTRERGFCFMVCGLRATKP